ncbi:MAG: hypothetical protein ACYTFI_21865, partial [Planctomycetota bacterium]
GGGLRRFVVGVLFSAILIGGAATVYYLYLKGEGKDPVTELSDGIGGLADRFRGGKGEKAGEKLRDLGLFIEEHGDDIHNYGDEVERRLEDIKGVSEEAYRAAKKKVDDFRQKKSDGKPDAEPGEQPQDGSPEEPAPKSSTESSTVPSKE